MRIDSSEHSRSSSFRGSFNSYRSDALAEHNLDNIKCALRQKKEALRTNQIDRIHKLLGSTQVFEGSLET